MFIAKHKKFLKAFKKQDSIIKFKFLEVLDLFSQNPHNPRLNTHPLRGKFKYLQSFDVTADVRVHFYIQDDVYVLVNIGTHSELY